MAGLIYERAQRGYEQLAKPNRGRTLIAGRTEDGMNLVLINLAGGRSIGSQNRLYERVGSQVRTKVFDQNLPSGDPAATIYVAQDHEVNEVWSVISNGIHTERVLRTISSPPHSMEVALWPFEHEGEKNANTPRIAVAAETLEGRIAYFGRVYADPFNPKESARQSNELALHDGFGYFISTYDGKGGTETSLEMPTMLAFQGSFEDIAERVWATADPNTTAIMAARRIRISHPEDYSIILRDRVSDFRAKYLASLASSQ